MVGNPRQSSFITEDRRYLKWYVQRGISRLEGMGYRWFVGTWIPRVQRLEAASTGTEDAFLLSDCYYLIGDVHDFHDAPKAAMRAYKKSFSLDASHVETLRELGTCSDRIGKYDDAIRYFRRYLRARPGDESIQGDLVTSEIDKRFSSSPLYRAGDALWDARELLAKDRPDRALSLLRRKRRVKARKLRAAAHGALGCGDGVLSEWRGIARSSGPIEMEYTDWFYLPDTIWDLQEFWQLLAGCRGRFTYGIWFMHDDLPTLQSPSDGRSTPKVTPAQSRARIKLHIEYHLARTGHDGDLARSLARRYPAWSEAVQLAAKMNS